MAPRKRRQDSEFPPDALDALKGDYYRKVRDAASATQAKLSGSAPADGGR